VLPAPIVDALIGVVLAAWLVLSIINQIHRGKYISRIKRHDQLALIPTWTFFAPRPGTTDFHVMYRDCTATGGFSRWREIAMPRPGRMRAVFNPSKRLGKGVTDMCNTLLRLSRQNLGGRLCLQIPYLTLLQYACAVPRTEASHSRQFAIVRTTGHGTPRDTTMLFVSALHRLDVPAVVDTSATSPAAVPAS